MKNNALKQIWEDFAIDQMLEMNNWVDISLAKAKRKIDWEYKRNFWEVKYEIEKLKKQVRLSASVLGMTCMVLNPILEKMIEQKKKIGKLLPEMSRIPKVIKVKLPKRIKFKKLF